MERAPGGVLYGAPSGVIQGAPSGVIEGGGQWGGVLCEALIVARQGKLPFVSSMVFLVGVPNK